MVLAVFGFADFRVDELECEHAIARLEECCDNSFYVDEYACDYSDGCGSIEEPILSEAQAICIQELDCDEVRAQSLCETVPELVRPYQEIGGEPQPSEPPAEVCR